MNYRTTLTRNSFIGLVIFLSGIGATVQAQNNVTVFDKQAEKVISSFRGKSFAQLYAQYSGQSVQPLPEEAQRVIAARYFSRLEAVLDEEFVAQVRHQIKPVLQLYRLERINILIYRNNTPLASTVPGSVLMLSTGLINAAASRDELRAVVAHELAHDLLFRLASEALLSEDYSLMRQIEMMCDGFSVAALAELRGDLTSVPLIMRKVLLDDEIHQHSSSTHPVLKVRLQVVAALSDALTAKDNS